MSKITDIRHDGWENEITGLGNLTTDKSRGMRFAGSGAISDYELERLYNENDIAATIVEATSTEAFRRTVTASSDVADIKDKEGISSQIEAMIGELEGHEKQQKAATWGALFGGGLAVMSIDDGQAFDKPLNLARTRSIDAITVFDKRDFTHPLAAHTPGIYTLHSSAGFDQSKGLHIHESRILLYGGALTTRRTKAELGYWDHSVLRRPYQAMADFAASWLSVGNMMADSSIGVLKVNGFFQMLGEAGYKEAFAQRLDIMNLSKFVGRTLPIDSTESFDYIERTFSGVPELLEMGMYRLSAAARMPATKLFGRSPAGMNATGESDLTIWYGDVESAQRRSYGPNYDYLIQIIAHILGAPEPISWFAQWAPLWTPTEKEQAETRKIYADIDVAYITAGVLDPDEVAATRFVGDWSSEAPTADMAARSFRVEQAPPEPPPVVLDDTTSVSQGDDADGRQDVIDDFVPPKIMLALQAVKTMAVLNSPAEMTDRLFQRLANELNVTLSIDDIVWGFSAEVPIPAVTRREDFGDLSSNILTDLFAIETITGANGPQQMIRQLAARVAAAMGISDDVLLNAILTHHYEIRPASRTVSILVAA